MTVSSEVNRSDFAGNGSTTNFATGFRFLQNADIKVILTVTATGVETVQVLDTDYTLTGAGLDAGGTVIMTVAPATGTTLTIKRDIAFTQLTDYVENDPFPAESHEDALDKVTMLVQQQQEELDRSLKLSESQQSSGLQIPAPVLNNLLRWDASGNLVNVTVQQLGTIADAGDLPYSQGGTGAVTRDVEAKLREKISAEDHGAAGTGLGDDLAAVNSAITDIGQTRKDLDLAGKTYKLSADPTNTFGVPFRNGKILSPSLIAGQDTQHNTYADDSNGLMIARENLAAWWKSVTAEVLQTIYIFGDSTVEMDGSFPVKSHELFKNALFSAGVNNCLTVNRGSSGTSWSDLNAVPDLGAGTKLIVIKYGINDAVKANPLTTMASDARSKLTAIRAATNGDFDNLSILLMGPNSTYAPTTDQDAKWYEDLRELHLQLCKEFDCAYFDVYAYLQQTKNAPGLWMDDIGGGEGIHPDPVAAYWIWWEGIKTHVIGDGQWNTQKGNQFWNINNFTRVAFETSEPQTYPFGTTVESALTANGWPFNGVLVTTRHSDGVAVQTLSSQDVVPRTATRRGGGLVWTQFAGESNDVSAFLNSWVNVGGGFDNAGYQVQSDGFVELFGGISSGVSGASAFTLPVGARPSFAHRYLVANNANIIVFADGNVIPTTADTTHVSLDGIRFKVL